MQFRTEIPVPHASIELSHTQSGLLVGSCFTTNIGTRLAEAKFPVMVNPLGTVYNPVSVATVVDILTGKRQFTESDVFFANGVWQSFLLHTDFSGLSKEEVLARCNEKIALFQEQFKNLDYAFFTLGTAWVYELVATNQIVCNCHKMPANQFRRKRLAVAECVSVLQAMVESLKALNPKVEILFTVSPIRHWKDGAHENQVSKATLLLAIEELQKQQSSVGYFPAYELLMDDLRDYRFYDDDMLHPNKQAVEYIWQKFADYYFSEATKTLVQKLVSVRRAVEHRPFNAKSQEYVTFVQNTIAECAHLQAQNPCLDFTDEIKTLEANLR